MLSFVKGTSHSIGHSSRLTILPKRVAFSSEAVSASSSSSSGSMAVRRLVVSRRAWQNHAKTLPKKHRVKKEDPNDKPWPRNVQIAGYIAAGIFIPYTTLWLITSNPTLRETFSFLPFDQFRTHFGVVEWDAQSYEDDKRRQAANQPVEAGFYQYPFEPPFRDRQQQVIIEDLDNSTITTHLYLLGDQEMHQTKPVPGSTKANPQVLMELIGSSSSSGNNVSVAVDFEDEANTNYTTDSTNTDGMLQDDISATDASSSLSSSPQPLVQETHTFSSWYYHPPPPQQQESQRQQRTSDYEMQVSRLEYTIVELEQSLKDPSCTRDMDDMTAELSQARKELRRLKWKKRLGMK